MESLVSSLHHRYYSKRLHRNSQRRQKRHGISRKLIASSFLFREYAELEVGQKRYGFSPKLFASSLLFPESAPALPEGGRKDLESLLSSLYHHYYSKRLRNSKRKDMESLATLFYHHYYPQGFHRNFKGGRKDVESLVSSSLLFPMSAKLERRFKGHGISPNLIASSLLFQASASELPKEVEKTWNLS